MSDSGGRRGLARLFFAVVALFALFIGSVAGVGATVTELTDRQHSQTVASTEGTITESEVIRRQWSTGGGVAWEFVPRVNYTYTVDGETYRVRRAPDTDFRGGERLRGEGFAERRAARDVVETYQEGDKVTVYYLPDEPADGYLRPPQFEPLAMLPFHLIFLVGIGSAYVAVTGRPLVNDTDD